VPVESTAGFWSTERPVGGTVKLRFSGRRPELEPPLPRPPCKPDDELFDGVVEGRDAVVKPALVDVLALLPAAEVSVELDA
jgi:hypothetical protein